MKSIWGLLALFITVTTAFIVVFVRSYEPSEEPAPTSRDTSVESDLLEDRPLVWSGLTIFKNGAELKDASRVVVLLHGLGDRAENFSKIENAFATDDETCFVYPEAPIPWQRGYAWFRGQQTYQPSRDKVVELLKFIKQENPSVDIVLGGFSQGAMMSSNFLEKDVELLSAIILLAPSGQLRDDITGNAKVKPPVFLAHGRDDRVLPFEGSEQLYDKLVEHDYPVQWVPFDGGHFITHDVLAKVNGFLARTKAED